MNNVQYDVQRLGSGAHAVRIAATMNYWVRIVRNDAWLIKKGGRVM